MNCAACTKSMDGNRTLTGPASQSYRINDLVLTSSECHMYVYMNGADDPTTAPGLICGSRNFTQFDGWTADASTIPMDPDTSPQVRLTYLNMCFNRAFHRRMCTPLRSRTRAALLSGTPTV